MSAKEMNQEHWKAGDQGPTHQRFRFGPGRSLGHPVATHAARGVLSVGPDGDQEGTELFLIEIMKQIAHDHQRQGSDCVHHNLSCVRGSPIRAAAPCRRANQAASTVNKIAESSNPHNQGGSGSCPRDSPGLVPVLGRNLILPLERRPPLARRSPTKAATRRLWQCYSRDDCRLEIGAPVSRRKVGWRCQVALAEL
jgi:hypothetical protein